MRQRNYISFHVTISPYGHVTHVSASEIRAIFIPYTSSATVDIPRKSKLPQYLQQLGECCANFFLYESKFERMNRNLVADHGMSHHLKTNLTFALVSNDPNPQNVPPPVAVPPTLSNSSSDSTFRMLTPLPILTSRYGNIFGSALRNLYSGSAFLSNSKASQEIFFNKKLQPFIKQQISSSLSTLTKINLKKT